MNDPTKSKNLKDVDQGKPRLKLVKTCHQTVEPKNPSKSKFVAMMESYCETLEQEIEAIKNL